MRKVILIGMAISLSTIGLTLEASAASSLSIASSRGGMSIDLGTITNARRVAYDEVTVRVQNNVGGRYRVIQSVSAPLTNEHGVRLEPGLVTLELASGSQGRLAFTGQQSMRSAPMELYTSERGAADSFIVVYSLPRPDALQVGTYTGAVTFTLETGSAGTVDTLTVQMRVTVESIAGLEFADSSPRRVGWNRLEPGVESDPVSISLQLIQNLPAHAELVHILDGPLRNDRGDVLPWQSAHVVYVSPEGGLLDRPLEQRLALPLSSGASSTGSIQLSYRVTIPPGQPAGRYRAQIQVQLLSQTIAYSIEAEVMPVLALEVRSPEGGAPSMGFSHLFPGKQSEPKQIVLDIRTNTGEQYEVLQDLAHPLVSSDGHILPAEALVCSVSQPPTGQALMSSEAPVAAGRRSLYRSDARGSPVTLALQCGVRVPEDAFAGDYQTSLTFTITSF